MRPPSDRSRKKHRGPRRALAACVAAMLTACAAVDAFAPTAVDYNLQAEQIRDQTILLNIIRAAYRKPMQFSDFSTVTGLTTASVTAAFALPFAAIPGSMARAFTAMPSGTLTGGPNFTVSILNTKEFYNGIMQPLSLQFLTLYLHEGFPRQLLLTLLIADIEYEKNGKVIHAYNNAESTVPPGEQYADFHALLQHLISRGLDAEEVDETTPIGPPLAEKEVSSLATLAGLPPNEVLAKYDGATPDANLTAAERAELKAKGVRTYYRLEKTTVSYRLCFDGNSAQVGQQIADTGLVMNAGLVCGAAANVRASAPMPASPPSGAHQQLHTLRFGLVGAAPALQTPVGAHAATPGSSGYSPSPPSSSAQELTMTTMSVEQLIYYLGEVARAQLGLNGPPMPCRMVATDRATSVCLFRLQAGPPTAGAISATYDGKSYAIQVDPAGHDRSSQVLELVSQLLALNNSAKDLPAPSIIPVIH
jgi:hypothetical protein